MSLWNLYSRYRVQFENQKLIVFLLLNIKVKKIKNVKIVEYHVSKSILKSIFSEIMNVQ